MSSLKVAVIDAGISPLVFNPLNPVEGHTLHHAHPSPIFSDFNWLRRHSRLYYCYILLGAQRNHWRIAGVFDC